jgi:DNA-3-methyladenine glycosylase
LRDFVPERGGRGGDESATPWAWRSSISPLPSASFPEWIADLDTEAVARGLLGCLLRSTVQGLTAAGVIVETEAYVGPHDPASHAAAPMGRTSRNASMFGPAGQAYVYRSYGIHWCLNVVTEEVGFPAAVLIRALDPVEGIHHMIRRREGRQPLCSGPGRLCEALGVSGALDGHSLRNAPLTLEEGWWVPEEQVRVSGRVGVRRASDWPLRFFLRGHPEVSRSERSMEKRLPTESDTA